jgi:D-glycero-D-manno-heptose 1,7-bisphosphate phosphatase
VRARGRGAIIFDRDGVLNRDVGYAHRPDQIEWVEGAIAAVKAVNDAGLFAFVATNQSGVARGYYGEAEVAALHQWMSEAMGAQGAHIDAFVYSPFHPEGSVERFRQDTDCRKPGPGMILDLLARFPVDRSRTVLIGDKASDLEAAQAAGIEGLLFQGGDLHQLVRPVLARLAR